MLFIKISRGFTLIELMIAVVLVGIIGTVAAPSYNRMMEAARARDAQSMLIFLFETERLYNLDNETYADLATLTADGYLSGSPENADWEITVALTGGGAGYDAAAERTAGTHEGKTLTLDETFDGATLGGHADLLALL